MDQAVLRQADIFCEASLTDLADEAEGFAGVEISAAAAVAFPAGHHRIRDDQIAFFKTGLASRLISL